MSTTETTYHEYSAKAIMSIGEKLYLNEEMADFHFIVESDDDLPTERIPAHKIILANASDYFRAMFSGNWIEKSEVEVPDASPAAFKEFLQFIYLPQVKLTTENLSQVMCLGHYYGISECVDACKDLFMNTLTVETVCLGYETALLLDEKDLIGFCEEKIKTHALKVLVSKNFQKCDRKILDHILRLDSLYCTAARLIRGLMFWVKQASKEKHLTREIIDEHLKESFYNIPFGSMSHAELIAFDDRYQGILTGDEYKEISRMIESKDFKPKLFNANRKFLLGNLWKWLDKKSFLDNLLTVDFNTSEFELIENIEKMTISTNKKIFLVGYYCECEPGFPTKITITKINVSTSHGERLIIYKGKSYFNKSGTLIVLTDPILIKPGYVYEIKMEQQISNNFCKKYSFLSEVEVSPGIIVNIHPEKARKV